MKQQHLLILWICSFFYCTAFAQPGIVGQTVAGGALTEQLTATCLTKDGGWIEGGYSNSNASGEKTENSRGGWDYWIVKYNKSGKIEWDKTIGGSGTDILTAIQQTSDGGFIAGGHSSSNISGEKTENSRGVDDYWIVKLDNKGNIQWDKTYGGSDGDELTSLLQTNDGGYILGGASSSDISGEKSENSRGASDYWVIKIDSIGKKQWDKTIGGNGSDILNSLLQNANGDYILNGSSESNISGEKTENNRCNCSNTSYNADYWVVKLNARGKKVWDKTIGGSLDDQIDYITPTSDAGYIISGASESNISGEKTQNSKGSYDYWIVKLNAQGSIQWDRTIGGNQIDGNNAVKIEQTSDKGFIIASESESGISGDKTEDNRCHCTDDDAFDYWIVKTDSSGNIQWDKTIGGDQYEVTDVAAEIGPNIYLITGSSYSNISGDKTIASRGSEDYWPVLLRYKNNSVTTSNVIAASAQDDSFSIYPNPAKDILYVRNTGEVSITISNQSGKIILRKKITGNAELNVAELVPGIYYLKNNTTNAVVKFSIAR